MRGSFSQFKKTKLFRALTVVLALSFLVWWNPGEVFRPVRLVLGVAALPFERMFASAGFHVASVKTLFGSIGDLKKENERLVAENVRLMAENALLVDMRRENESLRRELELLPRQTFELEGADVIGQDPLSLGNWLLINKGSSHGIEKGMPVIVNQSVLVGRVEEVLPRSARVILLTNPDSLVNGLDTQTEAKGIVKGQYGLGLILDMVLQTETLQPGDDVVTSGLGGDLPRGLLLGKVQEVRPSGDRLFQQASVVSPVKFTKLQSVFVIKEIR
jgi:rod shape-determining protein MreC